MVLLPLAVIHRQDILVIPFPLLRFGRQPLQRILEYLADQTPLNNS
jgi:hypothetical protein